MLNKKAVLAAIITMTLAVSVGCTSTKPQNQTGNNDNIKQEELEQNQKREKKIMEELDQLKKEKASLAMIIEFLDQNMQYVSLENASSMISDLEQAHSDYLPEFEDKFYSEKIQIQFQEAHKSGMYLNDLNDLKDVGEDLKELLSQTKNTGYKVETTEGMYFPIVNYDFYEKYTPYATKDVKEYIDIMAIESSKVPAKDAALVISWDTVFKRALRQEAFIKQYADSIRIDRAKQLFSAYVSYSFYGLNNTPLFDYDTKTMNKDAKKVYLQNIKNESDSEFIKSIKDFISILEKNDYKITKEVDSYRKNALENLSNK